MLNEQMQAPPITGSTPLTRTKHSPSASSLTSQTMLNPSFRSSIVKSTLVTWPTDLSFHALKAVLTAESNNADVRIDFYMDNVLQTTQFGQGFVGKPLWL